MEARCEAGFFCRQAILERKTMKQNNATIDFEKQIWDVKFLQKSHELEDEIRKKLGAIGYEE